MKFTIALIGLLSLSTSWAETQKIEESKDKREAPLGYPSSGHSSQTLQIQPSIGHDDSNTISIGAGYSVGGAKGAFGYGGHAPSSGYQFEGLQSSGGHAALQLPPITLQPNHGNIFSGDISQLMSQLSHGLSTGQIQLQPISSGSYSPEGSLGAHEGAQAQYSFAAPKFQQYSLSEQQISVPSYAAGTKGLGSYGSTGPVLFSPADTHNIQAPPSFGGASGGHNFGDASISLSQSGHSFGAPSGHSFGSPSGHSFASPSGNSYASPSSNSYASSSGHSYASPSFKTLGGGYAAQSGKTSFKPSAFLGSSFQGDSAHGISGLSTHAIPSFGHSISGANGHISLGSGGHGGFGGSLGGFGGSSSKHISPLYLPQKSGGYSSSLEAISAFSGNGHSSSPPGTTYGTPASSYAASSAHAASSSPQYYFSPSKHGASASFGEGSTSYKAPVSSQQHGSLSSFSSGPKYSYLGNSGFAPKYASPKDSSGAYSESTYNTIKYSEELKPRQH